MSGSFYILQLPIYYILLVQVTRITATQDILSKFEYFSINYQIQRAELVFRNSSGPSQELSKIDPIVRPAHSLRSFQFGKKEKKVS